jgi:23S rRNA (pseudouridine1915-N3)-methyltransferase
MKISLLAVGRLKSGAEQTQFNRYFDLFNAAARNLRISPISVIEIGEGRSDSAGERKDAEAAELISKLGASRLIVLDEQGQMLSSYEFTAMFSRLAAQTGTARR